MSRYVIGIFSTNQDAKEASKSLDDVTSQAIILNRLQKFNEEDNSLKLDGIISGVSDVFIGLPAFVNPMSAVGLPPQQDMSEATNNQWWQQIGFTEQEAANYQGLMESGKTILAVKAEDNEDQISNRLKEFNVEEVAIHQF
jgi:hypothetical protein